MKNFEKKRGGSQLNFLDEIIVDNFAGGGGASTGMELATGRPVAIAINHDPDAILMHRTNHPYTEHLQASVWDVDPRRGRTRKKYRGTGKHRYQKIYRGNLRTRSCAVHIQQYGRKCGGEFARASWNSENRRRPGFSCGEHYSVPHGADGKCSGEWAEDAAADGGRLQPVRADHGTVCRIFREWAAD